MAPISLPPVLGPNAAMHSTADALPSDTPTPAPLTVSVVATVYNERAHIAAAPRLAGRPDPRARRSRHL